MKIEMRFGAKIAAVAFALLLSGGAAYASDFSADKAMAELGNVGRLCLAIVFLGFLLVGGYVIIQALVDARKNGGWGHFVIGTCMVLVAGIALWALMSMSGQDPQKITDSIKIAK